MKKEILLKIILSSYNYNDSRKQIINSKSVKATAYKQENRYLFHNQHYSAVLDLNVNN